MASILGYLRHQADLRGVDRMSWYTDIPVDCGQDTGGMRVADVVAVVVDQATQRQEVNPDVETRLLCAVRDLAPQWYHPVLRAYAASTSGPAFTASAKVAAVYDEDLDRWLESAGGDVDPEAVPGRHEMWFCDAMCLAHVRSGRWPTARRWAARGVSNGVGQFLRRESTGDIPVSESALLDWDAVVAARRADVHVDLASSDVASRAWRTNGLWAAIASAPVTAVVLGTMRGLPEHLRAVLGKQNIEEPEPVLAEDIAKFRRVLRYVAMREDRSAE
jgi:hypothetical protein